VLVTAAAVLFSVRQESLYRASAEVLLSNQNLASALTGTQQSTGVTLQADRVAQTQADLARVATVARRTIKAVGLDGGRSASSLLRSSSVVAKPNADLLAFAVTDHEPRLAARLATEYATQYVRYRQQLDTGALRRARAEVRARIDSLPNQRSSLVRSLEEKDQQLATMEALETANASVVEAAHGAVKVQPRPLRNGVLGALIGAVLGLVLAFIWNALDTRVRTSEEIGQALGLPLLARLPAPSRRLRRDGLLVTLADPRSAGAEAFRMLRTNLEFVRLGREVKTIAVTSAVEEEGKSTSVANLAVALARAGQDVALVDLDLRRPILHRFFDLRDHPGLTDVVLGHATLDEALTPMPFRDISEQLGAHAARTNGHAPPPRAGSLCVIGAGPLPPNPGDLVGTAALAAMLDLLHDRFDTVLVDTPPSLKAGDALTLSTRIDAIVVVVRLNVARRPMMSELRRLLDSSPTRKLGFLVTGAEGSAGYGYGGTYGDGDARAESMPAKQKAEERIGVATQD
jgi:succinoglycan biosynthesis transport protein ExoP